MVGFAVVLWAFDEDVDDKVSESHCNDGTSCMAGVLDLKTNSDYIDVPSVLGNCSDYYSWGDTRADYSDVDAAAAVAEEAAVVVAVVPEQSVALDFELDLVSAKQVVLRN